MCADLDELLCRGLTPRWRASGSQEGCHFDHSTQAAVTVLLRRELDARQLRSVAVAASDENTYDMALATWESFNATVRDSVQQVNTHGCVGYTGSYGGCA